MNGSRGRARSTPVAILTLLLSGCGPPRLVVTPSQPPAADAVAHLKMEVDTLLSSPALERGTWAVLVRTLDSVEPIYAVNERRLLTPASVMKIVTLAAAADQLGWDFSFETTVFALGAIDFGYLDGDLLVAGTGDPTVDDWDGAASQLFCDWADRLKRAGINVVGGRIVGDDNSFDEERLGTGWAWDDLAASYATGVGALQFNQNTARLSISPGTAVGQPATVSVIPSASAVTLESRVTTSAAGDTLVTVRRAPGSTALAVTGSIPLGSPPVYRNVSVDNPTLYFVDRLKEILVAGGIEVRGAAVDIDDLADPPRRADAVRLFAERSPPLAAMARTMMKDSQNTYAETLLRALGRPSGTAAVGLAAIRQSLAAWGLDSTSLVVADGSGLSRYNQATAESIVRVLAAVLRDERLYAAFIEALPVAGVDGTLEARMKGTAAEGNARAKTGSLSGVRALAGFVTSDDGEPLVFCILANHFGDAAALVEHTMDAIVVRLAQFSRR